MREINFTGPERGPGAEMRKTVAQLAPSPHPIRTYPRCMEIRSRKERRS